MYDDSSGDKDRENTYPCGPLISNNLKCVHLVFHKLNLVEVRKAGKTGSLFFSCINWFWSECKGHFGSSVDSNEGWTERYTFQKSKKWRISIYPVSRASTMLHIISIYPVTILLWLRLQGNYKIHFSSTVRGSFPFICLDPKQKSRSWPLYRLNYAIL